jgi:hypothetical protein
METGFEAIREVLQESNGMTAREILNKLKFMETSQYDEFREWGKRDVNSILYRMHKVGLVQKELRDSLRPYWTLNNENVISPPRIQRGLIRKVGVISGKPFGKSPADKNIKVKSIFEEYGALYLEEIQELLNMDYKKLEKDFPYYKKFVIDVSESLETWKKWSKEETIEAIRKASTYYFPLTGPNYQSLIDLGEIQGPGIQRIYKQFGWPEICKAAGVEFKQAPRAEYLRTWSDEELLNFVIRFLESPELSDSYHAYSKWRNEQTDHVPNIQSITKYLGTWTEVRNKSLESYRLNKGKELKS